MASTTTVLGGLALTAACPVRGSVNGTEGAISAAVACAVHVKNVGQQTFWVALQSQGAGGGWTVSETRLLYPGQAWAVPAPPAGQSWVVLAAPRRTVNAIMERVTLIGAGVLALAGIGAYTLWRDRMTLWHHLRRVL